MRLHHLLKLYLETYKHFYYIISLENSSFGVLQSSFYSDHNCVYLSTLWLVLASSRSFCYSGYSHCPAFQSSACSEVILHQLPISVWVSLLLFHQSFLRVVSEQGIQLHVLTSPSYSSLLHRAENTPQDLPFESQQIIFVSLCDGPYVCGLDQETDLCLPRE